ncbi:PolC-type DNA polymerase III [Aliibacillus thermotolerans]|uniref:PolC-type DNA polymerase III n=1 Tax=Aliibacillus thermotolerans TaxID=1834418 RepID=A0ABW0U8Q1_9BACI|nr:exonuclease domain-containing protein [Aliibacillus thermotolerans]MDA3128744.1 3'-5' exonuclease [Aliibacillus thermotolerans]
MFMFWKKKNRHFHMAQPVSMNTPLSELTFTVFDTETTGFSIQKNDRLIEIGAVQVEGLEVTDKTFHTFVNPSREIPPHITELTGIKEEDVRDAPPAFEAIHDFYQFMQREKSDGWGGHYLSFDVMVLKKELQREKYTFAEPMGIDTLDLIGFLNPTGDICDLEHYAKRYHTTTFQRHSALGDAKTTAHLLVALLRHIEKKGKKTVLDLINIKRNEYGTVTPVF